MSITNDQANTILERYIGTNDVNASLYLGLSTTTPTASGTNITEPTTGSYAREEVPYTSWGTANTTGFITNTTQIEMVEATADWGTVTYVFLANHSSSTGSAIKFYGVLSTSRLIDSGTTVTFPASGLTISMT